jgi:uncharacterized protein (UPF0248 family)
VWAFPALDGKYMLIWDDRRQECSIVGAHSYESSGLKDARVVARGFIVGDLTPDGREWFYIDGGSSRALHRVSLTDGKNVRFDWVFPGLRSNFTVREDGNEIAYTESYRKTRFVIIDNLFK